MPGRRRASPQISQIPRKTISPRHKTMPRGYGADGEICAFADAPRRTAGIRCSVCVLSFSSQLLLIRKLLAPAHTSPLKSRHFPLHCQTADGEICAFADAPRRTAGIRCSVCVLSFSSQLLLIRKLLAPAHTSPLKSRHFPLHCQTADEAKASSAVWRGWRDLRLERTRTVDSQSYGCQVVGRARRPAQAMLACLPSNLSDPAQNNIPAA